MTGITDRKNKYIGFRIAFQDYMRIAELCNRRDITITDFVLSAVYPVLERDCLTEAKKEIKHHVEQTDIPTKEKQVPILKNNNPEKTTNATIEALIVKEKIISQKLQQLKSI